VSSETTVPIRRALVLDANILVRAALGRRVVPLLEMYSDRVDFLTPEIAFTDVRRHLPGILMRRGLSPQGVSEVLEREILGRLPLLVTPVHQEVFADLETKARRRLSRRDESDWPFVALALKLQCPIWTEDPDFFGSGIATWTTDRIEMYLSPDG